MWFEVPQVTLVHTPEGGQFGWCLGLPGGTEASDWAKTDSGLSLPELTWFPPTPLGRMRCTSR